MKKILTILTLAIFVFSSTSEVYAKSFGSRSSSKSSSSYKSKSYSKTKSNSTSSTSVSQKSYNGRVLSKSQTSNISTRSNPKLNTTQFKNAFSIQNYLMLVLLLNMNNTSYAYNEDDIDRVQDAYNTEPEKYEYLLERCSEQHYIPTKIERKDFSISSLYKFQFSSGDNTRYQFISKSKSIMSEINKFKDVKYLSIEFTGQEITEQNGCPKKENKRYIYSFGDKSNSYFDPRNKNFSTYNFYKQYRERFIVNDFKNIEIVKVKFNDTPKEFYFEAREIIGEQDYINSPQYLFNNPVSDDTLFYDFELQGNSNVRSFNIKLDGKSYSEEEYDFYLFNDFDAMSDRNLTTEKESRVEEGFNELNGNFITKVNKEYSKKVESTFNWKVNRSIIEKNTKRIVDKIQDFKINDEYMGEKDFEYEFYHILLINKETKESTYYYLSLAKNSFLYNVKLKFN